MSYSSSLPRERERYVDRTEREVYPEQSFLSSGRQPIQYTERAVRYKDESSGLWGFLLSHKFLIASLLLGLLFFTSMNSHDIDSHYYRDRGILDRTSSGIHSFGDRVSDGFNSIRDKIFPRRSMTDRLYDNVRGSAYDAKGRLIDGVDSLSSGAADVRDRVSGGLSYLGDKIRGTAEDARDSIYDTMYDSHAKVRRAGRGVSDRLYDTKDRLMDRFDDDYEYVRRPMRRARRSMNRSWRSHSSWSVMDMIAEHPILSTLLGLLLFFSLKPLFSSSHSSSSHRSGGIVNSLMTPRRTTLTGLALIMDKIGSFLAFLGDKVRASDNFSDMRSNRGTYNFDRSSEYARDFNSQPVSSSSSDMYRSDNIDTRGSSIDTRDSNIESSSRFSHVPVRDHTSSSVRDQSVLNSSLSSGVSSSASTRSSDMLGHTAPSAEYGTSSITSTQSSTSNNNTWPKLSDSSKFKEASTADIIKSEGQARPTIGGR